MDLISLMDSNVVMFTNLMNNLSVNIFELNFYQDQNERKHKLIPTEVSKSKQIKFLIF